MLLKIVNCFRDVGLRLQAPHYWGCFKNLLESAAIILYLVSVCTDWITVNYLVLVGSTGVRALNEGR